MSQADPPQLLGPDPIAAAQRDDGSLSNDDLISAYESGPQRLRDAVAGLTPEQLRARPVEGRWSTLEVVCHLADCEQFFADRMKRTIATDRPLLLGAQGGRYPEPLRYHDRDVGGGTRPDRPHPAADGPHPPAPARRGVVPDGGPQRDRAGDAAATGAPRRPAPGAPPLVRRREAAGSRRPRGRGS